MSLRVGVLSPFWHNYNYGGKLQALAMVHLLQQFGCDACQISYYQPSAEQHRNIGKSLNMALHSADYRSAIFQKMMGKCLPGAQSGTAVRKSAFDRYDAEIAHTQRVYTDADIVQTVDDFDVFVCGSDQVWNPSLFKESYFLPFVPAQKYKFSYAASVANELTQNWKAYFCNALSRFDAISVREKKTQQMLQQLLPDKEIFHVLDPTLMLPRETWTQLAVPVDVQKPYLLCYFLGYSHEQRRAAHAAARRTGKLLVTFPHLLGTAGRFYACDVRFGDVQLYDVSPGQFIWLIQNADGVLTDSFHAAVLSTLFCRPLAVFGRTGSKDCGSRVLELLQMFGLEQHFCNHAAPDQVLPLLENPLLPKTQGFSRARAVSMAFLRANLQNAENKK